MEGVTPGPLCHAPAGHRKYSCAGVPERLYIVSVRRAKKEIPVKMLGGLARTLLFPGGKKRSDLNRPPRRDSGVHQPPLSALQLPSRRFCHGVVIQSAEK